MGRDAGEDVVVVTGDRDVFQLVEDPHIKVLYNKKGVSDYALYDEKGILEITLTANKVINNTSANSDNCCLSPGDSNRMITNPNRIITNEAINNFILKY